jgi:hypothetical protein
LGDELNEEEIEHLEEGINQMVRDIPRPLFINKLNQKKLCGEESKQSGSSIIVIGGIYGIIKTKSNKEADAIIWQRGEFDSYNNVLLFYTANDEQMDQRTLSALSHLSRGYDMV